MFRQRQCSIFNNRTIDPLLPVGVRFEPKYNGMIENFFLNDQIIYINGELHSFACFYMTCFFMYDSRYHWRCNDVEC